MGSCGLVLAAGQGSRFGGAGKLTAPLAGRPLLEHAVAAQCAVDELTRVVVVLGARAEAVRRQVSLGRAEIVECADWPEGQSASLRSGLAALRGAERVIVTLGDQPLISPAAIRRLLSAPDGSRAAYGGVPGHPVVLGPAQIMGMSDVRGDEGARGLLSGPLIDCTGLGSAADVDTAEDLERLAR